MLRDWRRALTTNFRDQLDDALTRNGGTNLSPWDEAGQFVRAKL